MVVLPLALLLALAPPAPAGTALADELRRARADDVELDDRLSAARRAYGLVANAETTALFKATFLDVERDLLAHTRAFERLRASCVSPDAAPLGVEGCVRELAARSSARAMLVDVQGDEVVSVVLGTDDAALHVVHGVVRRALQQRGRLTLDLEVARARIPRDGALERALLSALPNAPRADAFAGPVLSRTSREVLAALPERAVELTGVAGHRVIPERCAGAPTTRMLEQSWLGQAHVASTAAGVTSRQVVFDAWRVERGAELALDGRHPLRVTWPTAEGDVIELDGVAWGATEAFPRAPALNCPR
ncbi:MAG: hypothetical protein IT383_20995 [Deltaproteobacteria bacterium]|nr:hypothetical protein [Deltaproteobacteria bacterium]